jgi:hypothetical protein
MDVDNFTSRPLYHRKRIPEPTEGRVGSRASLDGAVEEKTSCSNTLTRGTNGHGLGSCTPAAVAFNSHSSSLNYEVALVQLCLQVSCPSSAPSKLLVSEGQGGEAWGYSNNVMSFHPPTKIKNTCLLEDNQACSARPSDMSNKKVKRVVTSSSLNHSQTRL